MVRRKQRKVVGFGAFITISVVFLMITLGMVWFLQAKSNEVVQVNQTLQIEQQKSINLQSELEEIKKQSEQLNIQVEELKEEIKILQTSKDNKSNKISGQRIAYLTFDDGPSDNTANILDFLKENNIKATFFVTGHENRMDLYKRIVDEGHTLGNHTYGHDYGQIYKSADTFLADVEKLNDLLERATGQRSKIIRFPGGSNNTVSRHAGGAGIMDVICKEVTAKGYKFHDWNVDSLDASKTKQSMDIIINSVVGGSQYTDNAMILMHDAPAKTTTVDALPQIVEGLKKQGFIFKAIDVDTPEVQF